MNRRTFFSAVAAAPALSLIRPSVAAAELPKAKVTRVRIYKPPDLNPLFNQSNMVAMVETNIGITGIGEGGAKDTLEQCAGTLIGQNPFRTEALWHEAYIAWFYPPGREKAHALGALDLALWDIKGKALGLPVHELLGGAARDYCECYATGGATPPGTPSGARLSLAERARATMEAGYRAFRMGAGGCAGRRRLRHASVVRQVDRRVQGGPRSGRPDRQLVHRPASTIRSERRDAPLQGDGAVRAVLRRRSGPRRKRAAGYPEATADDDRPVDARRGVGVEVGFQPARRESRRGLRAIDAAQCRRHHRDDEGAAICETHAVGIIPHFTGPIATAALVNCLSTFSGPVMMEYNYGGRPIDYLPECLDFKNGKAYTNQRPGLGVTADINRLTMIGEVTEPGRKNMYRRPDGSLTHW